MFNLPGYPAPPWHTRLSNVPTGLLYIVLQQNRPREREREQGEPVKNREGNKIENELQMSGSASQTAKILALLAEDWLELVKLHVRYLPKLNMFFFFFLI